ncbi:hypothetical protein M8C21_008822, partial [Ambrosia artemisiifolia]
MAFRKDV